MARVWFVRRRGALWVAPGGQPAFERPLAELIFPLDLGPHRRLSGDGPVAAAELPREDPAALTKVIVDVGAEDLGSLEFSAFVLGFYDSPYAPSVVAARLAATPARASAA